MFLLSGISSRAIILQPNAEPTLHLEKAKNLLIIMVHSAVFYFNISYKYLNRGSSRGSGNTSYF